MTVSKLKSIWKVIQGWWAQKDEPKNPWDSLHLVHHNLIRNAIMTPDGTVLESRHRHDFKTHLDKNGKTYMIDGGYDYSRRSNNGDETDLCLYDDQPHEVQRVILTWGTYGKNADQPLKHKRVCDMSDAHIQAVLDTCNPYPVLKRCMLTELEFRDELGFSVED